MTVKEYMLKPVQISELNFDDSNPNELTKKQKKSLKDVMKRYGFLVPIVIDTQKNVIDGQHRCTVYSQMGLDKIPAFIIDTTKEDYDKKFLRQWLNKFHGTPSLEKDIAELQYIMKDEVGALLLEEHLNLDAESVSEMIKSVDAGDIPMDNPLEDIEEPHEKGNRIVLYFTKHEFPEIQRKFKKLKEKYKVSTETEVVKKLIS